MVERDVEKTIEALLEERRTFAPPEEFTKQANVRDNSVYEQADADPEGWGSSQAERLHWFKPWDHVLRRDPPHHEWFVGGTLNASSTASTGTSRRTASGSLTTGSVSRATNEPSLTPNSIVMSASWQTS